MCVCVCVCVFISLKSGTYIAVENIKLVNSWNRVKDCFIASKWNLKRIIKLSVSHR